MRILVVAVLSAFVTAGCDAGPSPPPAPPASLADAGDYRLCDALAGAITDVASEPSWRQYGDYRPWTTADGCLVRIDVLADRSGPEHCGWQSARVIITGIPIGARYTDDRNDAEYVRDPDNVFGDLATASAFDPDAELPDGAVATGLRLQDTELWADAGDPSAIYLVSGTSVERWPLDPEPAVCA